MDARGAGGEGWGEVGGVGRGRSAVDKGVGGVDGVGFLLEDEDVLLDWIGRARAFVDTLPGK